MIFPKLLIGFSSMALCVVVHALGLTALLRRVYAQGNLSGRSFRASAWLLIRVAAWTVLLHLAQIATWAVVYVVAGR